MDPRDRENDDSARAAGESGEPAAEVPSMDSVITGSDFPKPAGRPRVSMWQRVADKLPRDVTEPAEEPVGADDAAASGAGSGEAAGTPTATTSSATSRDATDTSSVAGPAGGAPATGGAFDDLGPSAANMSVSELSEALNARLRALTARNAEHSADPKDLFPDDAPPPTRERGTTPPSDASTTIPAPIPTVVPGTTPVVGATPTDSSAQGTSADASGAGPDLATSEIPVDTTRYAAHRPAAHDLKRVDATRASRGAHTPEHVARAEPPLPEDTLVDPAETSHAVPDAATSGPSHAVPYHETGAFSADDPYIQARPHQQASAQNVHDDQESSGLPTDLTDGGAPDPALGNEPPAPPPAPPRTGGTKRVNPTVPAIAFAAIITLVGGAWAVSNLGHLAGGVDTSAMSEALSSRDDDQSSAPIATPEPTPTPEGPVITSAAILSAYDDGADHPDQAPALTDGNPETVWGSRYFGNNVFEDSTSVTIVINLAEPSTISAVTLDVNGGGGQVAVRAVTPDNPREGTDLATSALGPNTQIVLPEPTEVQAVALSFRSLPMDPEGLNRAYVREISVR